MQAFSVEASIMEGRVLVNQLFENVQNNAAGLESYSMEKNIFSMLMKIGLAAMECYFASRGTGNIGAELKLEDGTVMKRQGGLWGKDYFSVFGKLKVPRTCCWIKGEPCIMPSDVQMNLPGNCYSYLLQEWMNIMSVRESFKESETTLTKLLGLEVSASRFEVVSHESSRDYDSYYENRVPETEGEGEIQVHGFDGKGVPMIKREAVKLKARQGKGEKRQRKKEAMVGVSYTIDRNGRKPEDVADNLIYPERKQDKRKEDGETPKAQGIRRIASLKKSKKEVVEEIINDGKKRNRNNNRPCVVLMDGALGLWSLLLKVLDGTEFTGILDIIHVTEYLWKAGNALYGENTDEGREWVYNHLLSVLKGNVGSVIRGMKQTESKINLKKSQKKVLKTVIQYFENHRQRMKYDEYLKEGFPIGTGVVESTCGHTVKERMEGSGRRWSVEGAESVLLLRSVYTSGDWEQYWQVHMKNEQNRLYGNVICTADDYVKESQIKKAA